MTHPRFGERAIDDLQSGHPESHIDPVRAGPFAGPIATKQAAPHPHEAFRLISLRARERGARQNPVFIVQKRTVLHQKVQSLHQDPGTGMPFVMGALERQAADHDIIAGEQEQRTIGAGWSGYDRAQSPGLQGQAGRRPDRALVINARIKHDVIAIQCHRGRLGRPRQDPVRTNQQCARGGIIRHRLEKPRNRQQKSGGPPPRGE